MALLISGIWQMSIRVRGSESKVTDRVTDEVTDAEKRILNYLKIDPGYSYTRKGTVLCGQ